MPIFLKVSKWSYLAELQVIGEFSSFPKASVKALVVNISESDFLMTSTLALNTLIFSFLSKEDLLNGIKSTVKNCPPGGAIFIGLAYNSEFRSL